MGAGRTDGLIKNFGAAGAIPARRFVKFSGADDDTVVLATAATDAVTIEGLPAALAAALAANGISTTGSTVRRTVLA